MNIYTHTGFKGHWPVGTSAIVLAETALEAAFLLEAKLKEIGLSQSIDPNGFALVPQERGAIVLQDGDY